MLPFSNFARIMHQIATYDEPERPGATFDDPEHPASRDRRGSLIITLIPIVLIVLWATVFFKH